ncbi:pentatricopeptide repeat-containing protein At2g21090-like [Papaver somniferum]|uniref:pentatricopeptide repeat-containing protein At2g21090-like n=1 Tax=Papaver somniferum TaxID=3469 RepID=UPI000E6F6E83|nr:pentatricopeptide repeat-containing protein At2g21090-like [Papaver somniferum]XP_026406438.1 pentatricopeptide repeat-containing protein At2g21090-like [Papaver somniferum]XP_026406440.1 pentatricopeptide repeat-containing protein At2g21090-like [Papaver somniferum]XP_026406441.1 pentatricopeptide repeat-containing protein At2g21090-like [Papaver somniferum]
MSISNSLKAIDSSFSQYTSIIDECIKTRNIKLGRTLHSHLIKTALNLNVFLANRLIDMYAKCNSVKCAESAFDDAPVKNSHSWNTIFFAYSKLGFFGKAREVFDKMPNPNLVSYNSMISGLTKNGFHLEALDVFKKMYSQSGAMLIDNYTFVGVVTACTGLGELELVRQVHGLVSVMGLDMNLIMYNALIDAYGKCYDPDSSSLLFNQMPERDVVSWTSMVVAYALASRLEDARSVFDQIPVKNTVSWNALIAGLAQNGHGEEALDLFKNMQDLGVAPNAFTFVSVMSACADLALIGSGKQIHGHIIRMSSSRGELLNLFTFNALIDMYSKSGDMKSASILFDQMPDKDIVSWNSLVTGLAQNGFAKKSLDVFERLTEVGDMPLNHITFLGALSACSHMGLVSEGQRIFQLMGKYGVRPRSEHYALLIDMLGRNNKLEEAVKFVETAPSKLDRCGMWAALLGACRVHGNLDIARKAAEALFELEPRNSGRYVSLSNIYAATGRWDDARRVRNLMKERSLEKEVAYSWIEVRSQRHGFVAKDKYHCQMEEIYNIASELVSHMEAGYGSSKDSFEHEALFAY